MSPKTKPIIGISSSVETHNNIPSVLVHEAYIQSVIEAGGVPVVLPLGSVEMAKEWMSLCDGLLLSGGEDIDPHSFQADPSPQLKTTNGKRDKLEIELTRIAQKQQTPILGLCRGITLLNVALGGTVIQDIPTKNPKAINHYQQAARPEATHGIHIDSNSRLYQVLGRSSTRVNSMHHQAIDELAPTLKAVATAPDGVIEAVEGTEESPLLWGVQWHPDEMAGEDPSMARLFKEFVIECIKKK
ncbi:gamma-glutamyl-gamma-aminobutyrate hydrolase family protein [Shouchella shacheensis]|uniref:gamma-glutamyl-gamma-aminobutyrate hydrolase family protein n=1 Tax=Shouchella shacheensis TaxID=1649580 RepID=UPI00073FEB8D|nr:gamma-glutamyl-gamma-aminobutyrate hydrolase family protein [Shouchella shacheensis]